MDVGSETSREGSVPGQLKVLSDVVTAETRLRAAAPTFGNEIAVDFSPHQHTPAPELKIKFGDENEPESLRRMQAIGIALRSDDNPAAAVRLVLTKDFPNTEPAYLIAIREQLKHAASHERPDLAAAIFNDESGDGQDFWRTPTRLDEIDPKYKQDVVMAANGGQTNELTRLQEHLPLSYEVVIQAIFTRAQSTASESDKFQDALGYLHKIPGLEDVQVVFTFKNGDIKKALRRS